MKLIREILPVDCSRPSQVRGRRWRAEPIRPASCSFFDIHIGVSSQPGKVKGPAAVLGPEVVTSVRVRVRRKSYGFTGR